MKIKLFLKKVYFACYKLLLILKKTFLKDPIYIFGTPNHGNLGDQAILESEIKFFRDLGFKKVIPIEMSFAKDNISFLKKYVGDNPIYISGGGNFGTLWPVCEEMLRNTILNFPNNKIVVFPNTFYFDEKEPEELEKSKKIYSEHKNLFICCREVYSYEFMKKNFKDCLIYLIPDIVLYNNVKDSNIKRKNQVLMCLRNDKEKISNDYNLILNYSKRNKFSIKYTDTVLRERILPFMRKRKLLKKLKEFYESKLVITDRLHGMVFAYLTKTPCVTFRNCNYKIVGLYEWIKESNYIIFYDNNINTKQIDSIINIEKKSCDILNYYDKLKEIIGEC